MRIAFRSLLQQSFRFASVPVDFIEMPAAKKRKVTAAAAVAAPDVEDDVIEKKEEEEEEASGNADTGVTRTLTVEACKQW